MANYDPPLRRNPVEYGLPGSDGYVEKCSISTRNKAVIIYGYYEFNRYLSMRISQFFHRKTKSSFRGSMPGRN